MGRVVAGEAEVDEGGEKESIGFTRIRIRIRDEDDD